MPDTEPTMQERRETLVAILREKGIPLSDRLERAFLTVPRHLFVPGVYLDAVYADNLIVTKRDKYGLPISVSTRPSTIATILDALALEEGHNILEIGTGTGYNTGLIAEIVGRETGRVTALEIAPEIADHAMTHLARANYAWVETIQEDGAAGYAPNAPYDRIIATTSAWDLPLAWEQQLTKDGVLVAVLDFYGLQMGVALRPQADGALIGMTTFPVILLTPLQGSAAGPPRTCQVASSDLHIYVHETSELDDASAHTVFSDQHEFAQLPLGPDRWGQLSYYVMLHPLTTFRFITYNVAVGQNAYGLTGCGWGLFSPTSICLVPYGDERVVHVFGGSDAYVALTELAEAWTMAGSPTVEQYRLRVTPAGQEAPAPPDDSLGAHVFERPAHTYTLWIAPQA